MSFFDGFQGPPVDGCYRVTKSQAHHLINALGVYSGHSLEKRLKKARVEAGIPIMKGLQEFRR